jgi:hypothetical protein
MNLQISEFLNTVSINKDLWFQFLEDRLSFRYIGLPDDIHITISFNPNSPDINLHVSRNLDVENKPKVEVMRINKELLNEFQQNIGLSIFNSMLEPLPLKPYHLYSEKCGYFPWDVLNVQPVQNAFEDNLVKSFRPVSRMKGKKKFKIEGDLAQSFETLTSSAYLDNVMLKNIRPVPKVHKTRTEGGIMLFKNKSFMVIRIFDAWYKVRDEITIFRMLSSIIKPEILQKLTINLKKAIVRTRSANTYEEVKDAMLSERLTTELFLLNVGLLKKRIKRLSLQKVKK